MESSGINLALKGEGKIAFPVSRHHFPLAFVHSANNPHDRLSHLFYSSLAIILGREGEDNFPEYSALLLLSFIKQRASEQATIGVFFFIFLEPARSGLHNFFSPQEALESILFNHLCMSIGIPEFLDWLFCCFSTRWLLVVFFFLSSFYHCFSCSSAD